MGRADEQFERWRSDPPGFAAAMWPDLCITDYQRDILRSCVGWPETWVESANGVGKTMTAAIASLWFFLTRPAIVVTISPSADQLEKSLWLEIRHLLTKIDATDLGLVVGNGANMEIRRRLPDGSINPRSYMAGRCVGKTESLQGVHLPRLRDGTPTVMFTGEEATGVDDRFWPIVRTSAHTVLSIANPIRVDGEFYRISAAGSVRLAGRPHRNVIRVSGEDSPNVKLGMACAKEGLPLPVAPICPGVLDYPTFLDLKATLPPWEIGPRLYGRPNDQSASKLFPKEWLDFSRQLYRRLQEHEAALKARGRRFRWGGPFGLGVDCAMGGGDLSAWCVFGRYGVAHLETLDTPNTRAIKGKTLQLMRRYRIKPEWVCFDRAIGKGIADELREEGKEVNDVGFGESALDSGKYPNMRVELYGELAEAMGKLFDQNGRPRKRAELLLSTAPDQWPKKWRCVALPDDADLRQELFVLPRAQDSKDRLTLPPKEGTKSKLGVKQMLGGRSPDRADALVLAHRAWQQGREYHELSTVRGPMVY